MPPPTHRPLTPEAVAHGDAQREARRGHGAFHGARARRGLPAARNFGPLPPLPAAGPILRAERGEWGQH